MKKYLFMILILCASVSLAQVTKMYRFSGTATTVTTSLTKNTSAPYLKILSAEIMNDGAAGDTLWVSLNDDTTAANSFPLVNTSSVTESIFFSSIYVDRIRVKSDATTAYRARLH